jgi:hypothetical protein
MVVRGWLEGKPITLSLKPDALTVALDERSVVAFDRAGRLWSLYAAGHHFRRGLNGSVLVKWTDRGIRQRQRLRPSEADLVVHRTANIAQTLCDQMVLDPLGGDTAKVATNLRQDIDQILARAAAFDVKAAHADIIQYRSVYKPIGILPPDQYLALVLQVTEGCSFNTCTFCSFYKDRPFRIKSPQELRDHITAVRAFLGDSILLRRGIFLADANALVVPQAQMLKLLEVVAETMPRTMGISAFLDGFSGQKKAAKDYAALATRGLQRIYVGLESGHDPLLKWVKKPGRAADAVAAVHQMKAGGVRVGVIVLLGIGGERFDRAHVQDTIDVLNQMELDQDDLLYFSEFISHGTIYEEQIGGYGPLGHELRSLSRPRMEAQRRAIVAGLVSPDKRPRIATYDIREFVY